MKITEGIDLKYMAFDWDDNILMLPTKINMEEFKNNKWEEVKVSTSHFSVVRNNPDFRITNDSFDDFRDVGQRGDVAFIEDCISAIDNKRFGPAWNQFIKCLIRGNLFAIITARGHEPNTIKKAIKHIIKSYLSTEQYNDMVDNIIEFKLIFENNHLDRTQMDDKQIDILVNEYLNWCDLIGITSNHFQNNFPQVESASKTPELAKEVALLSFIKRTKQYGKDINAKSVSVGFSDDDKGNVNKIKELFTNQLSKHKCEVKYSLFDTSNKDVKKIDII